MQSNAQNNKTISCFIGIESVISQKYYLLQANIIMKQNLVSSIQTEHTGGIPNGDTKETYIKQFVK